MTAKHQLSVSNMQHCQRGAEGVILMVKIQLV